MKKLRYFIRFLTSDPLRLMAAACLVAAMLSGTKGWLAVVFLLGSSVFERCSLWRNLRHASGPEHFLRGAFAFSLFSVLLRLSMLLAVGSVLVPTGVAMVAAPLAVLVVPLPLAGLYLQHRRMSELIYPASARLLDPRFRALLLPRVATSPLAEWACAGAILALPAGVNPFATGLAVLAAAVFTVFATLRFLGSKAAARLRNLHVGEVAARIREQAPDLVFYHSGPAESLYQYRMWAPVLDKLSLRTLVVFRESAYLSEVAPAGHQTVFIRRFDHLFRLVPDSVKVILYAANGTSNINMLRWHLPAEHVFINHGESDKAVNVNYFLTVYSRLFVAGQQAVDRMKDCPFTIPPERFVIVGRPQVDALAAAPAVSGGRRTLLYAPTWEGWNPLENYSSLEKSGVSLIEHLLEHHPDLRIVFKPHPFCGKNRPAVAAAVRRICRLLENRGTHEVVAAGADIMPHLAAADLLVTDVSSVANDFLATGRPLVMTDALALGSGEFRSRFPTAEAAYLLECGAGNLDAILADAFGDDPMREARRRAFEYSLGGFRGDATMRFDAALVRLSAGVAALRNAARHSG